jgi:hypothetical protein
MSGRPSLYSEELAQSICDRLIEGESLRGICSSIGMPHRVTVIRWMALNADFATKCARARDEQADLMDDRILDIADKTERGEIDPAAARVVISALQWRASKLKPKKYGDKIELSGKVEHQHASVDALEAARTRTREQQVQH